MSYIFKPCQTCGKEFAAPIKEVNRGNGKFCSRSCACRWGNHLKGEGTSSSAAHQKARKLWIKRHRKEPLCIHCQKPADIHHDNGNWLDNKDENHIPLCRSHHASLENTRRKLYKAA